MRRRAADGGRAWALAVSLLLGSCAGSEELTAPGLVDLPRLPPRGGEVESLAAAHENIVRLATDLEESHLVRDRMRSEVERLRASLEESRARAGWLELERSEMFARGSGPASRAPSGANDPSSDTAPLAEARVPGPSDPTSPAEVAGVAAAFSPVEAGDGWPPMAVAGSSTPGQRAGIHRWSPEPTSSARRAGAGAALGDEDSGLLAMAGDRVARLVRGGVRWDSADVAIFGGLALLSLVLVWGGASVLLGSFRSRRLAGEVRILRGRLRELQAHDRASAPRSSVERFVGRRGWARAHPGPDGSAEPVPVDLGGGVVGSEGTDDPAGTDEEVADALDRALPDDAPNTPLEESAPLEESVPAEESAPAEWTLSPEDGLASDGPDRLAARREAEARVEAAVRESLRARAVDPGGGEDPELSTGPAAEPASRHEGSLLPVAAEPAPRVRSAEGTEPVSEVDGGLVEEPTGETDRVPRPAEIPCAGLLGESSSSRDEPRQEPGTDPRMGSGSGAGEAAPADETGELVRTRILEPILELEDGGFDPGAPVVLLDSEAGEGLAPSVPADRAGGASADPPGDASLLPATEETSCLPSTDTEVASPERVVAGFPEGSASGAATDALARTEISERLGPAPVPERDAETGMEESDLASSRTAMLGASAGLGDPGSRLGGTDRLARTDQLDRPTRGGEPLESGVVTEELATGERDAVAEIEDRLAVRSPAAGVSDPDPSRGPASAVPAGAAAGDPPSRRGPRGKQDLHDELRKLIGSRFEGLSG